MADMRAALLLLGMCCGMAGTLSAASVTLTWANPVTISYGTALSVKQLNAKANVPGQFAYTPAAGTILSAGTQALNVLFAPTDTANYSSAQKSVSLVVAKGAQTITFPAPPALHYGDADVDLTATASSGLAVSYLSSNPAVATIVNGNQLHVVGAGSVKITASQAGDGNRKPALAVAKTLVIAKKPQTIDFSALTVHAMGDADFSLNASAISGLPVTFTSSAPAVASVVAGKIHLVGKGTAVITASQVGNANWAVATPIKQTLVVAVGSQTISFLPLPNKGVGDVDFAPGATASSGLVVTYASSNLKVATIVAGKIHVIGNGTTTITAKQAGSASWTAAAEVTQTFTVGGKATPVLTWANPVAITYGTVLSAAQLNAKANVPGTYAYSPPAGTKLPIGPQSLNVLFTPTDATKYDSVQKSVPLTVNKVAATVTLTGLSQVYNGQPRIVTATTVPAGLPLDITYGGSPDAPTNVGSYPVVATVNDPNAGGTKSGTLLVAKGNQTISFATLPMIHVGDEDYTLTASAASGLAVSYVSSAPAVATIVDGKIHAVATGTTVITATQGGDGNWNAALPVKQTLTVPTDDQDIRALYATMKSVIENHDEPGFLQLFAPGYFHAGQDLAAQFDLGTGMLDTLKTFTFAITSITINGSDAKVAGTVTLTSNNGDPVEIWMEPDTANKSPGIGWLHKTTDGWRVMGNQALASYQVTSIHDPSPGDDHYFLRFHSDSKAAITSVSVSGPSIETTPLEADPDMGGFTGFAGHFTSAQRPPVGSVYTFVINFADSTQATYQDTIKSWVAAAPVVSVVPGAGTATINWTNVKASVPNAASYGVRIYGAGGESDSIWRGSEQLPLTQTSIAFNADGTATGELIVGQSYTAVVTIFDSDGNYAFRTCEFTIPPPPGFSLIPAGSFQMGDSVDGIEVPVHTVQVSAFYMAKNLVTKEEWDAVLVWGLTHGYTDLSVGASKAANHPVQSITWYDMVKWCNARSEMEGLTACYTVSAAVYRTGSSAPVCNWSANGYRLPSEAEWEKAARGGLSGKRFPWGDTITQLQANYNSSTSFAYDVSTTRGYHPIWATAAYPYTSPVGSFTPNGYGLYDMTGNLLEWCWDWYDAYTAASQTDPRGAAPGFYRVLRGGSWLDNARYCRVADRAKADPFAVDFLFGFRVARSSVP
jgi:formylglycine-generating enzyme required for sulfatase activity